MSARESDDVVIDVEGRAHAMAHARIVGAETEPRDNEALAIVRLRRLDE